MPLEQWLTENEEVTIKLHYKTISAVDNSEYFQYGHKW